MLPERSVIAEMLDDYTVSPMLIRPVANRQYQRV
jgi:hypothetical protein